MNILVEKLKNFQNSYEIDIQIKKLLLQKFLSQKIVQVLILIF